MSGNDQGGGDQGGYSSTFWTMFWIGVIGVVGFFAVAAAAGGGSGAGF